METMVEVKVEVTPVVVAGVQAQVEATSSPMMAAAAETRLATAKKFLKCILQRRFRKDRKWKDQPEHQCPGF